MIELYPYQKEMKRDIYRFWKYEGKHLIACAPPRSGKTVVFSSIAKDFADNGRKTLLLTDRDVILFQANNVFLKFGLSSFFIRAGCEYVNDNFSCYIAMAHTLRNRLDKEYWINFIKSFEDGAIFIDECHEQIFNFLLESGLIDDIWLVGLTGTPARRGKMRQLGLDYRKISQVTSPQKLLNKGRLLNADIYDCGSPNISDVGISSLDGDYNKSQLFKKFNNAKLYAGTLKNYQNICNNTKFMHYCVSKEHAIKSAINFYEAGYNVKFIVSSTGKPKKIKSDASEADKVRYEENIRRYELYQKWFSKLSGDREQLFNDFYRTKILGLINVDIATKGFDCPDMETVILDFATLSLTRYLQAAMRGATYYPGKTHYNLLDQGGNYERFGDPMEDRIWNIWHEESKGNGLPVVKNCGFDNKGRPIVGENKTGGCRALILASYMICPSCGFKYKYKELEEKELELRSPTGKKSKRINQMSYGELYEYWKKKGHKSPWLWRQLWYRGGEDEIRAFGHFYGWSFQTIKKAINFCSKL